MLLVSGQAIEVYSKRIHAVKQYFLKETTLYPMGGSVSTPAQSSRDADHVGTGLSSVFEIRREQLAKIVRRWGGQSALAKTIGKKPGYISLVLSGKKRLGESLAREIESTAGLPAGYLDGNPDTSGLLADLEYESLEVAKDYQNLPAALKHTVRAMIEDLGATALPSFLQDIDESVFEIVVAVADDVIKTKKVNVPLAGRLRHYFELYEQCKAAGVTDEAGVRRVATR